MEINIFESIPVFTVCGITHKTKKAGQTGLFLISVIRLFHQYHLTGKGCSGRTAQAAEINTGRHCITL